MNDSPNLTQAVPFFNVKDIQASLHFYVEGLGFEKKLEWVPEGRLRWCSLSRGEVSVMLQEYLPAHLPAEKLGVGVTVCIFCEDALTLYREFKARGIAASKPFVGNGLWVTTVTDPDGYRLDFESPTDAPEESEYAE